jgi:hypothetical protein
MQEVPIVTVPVIVGINSTEAVHGETPMITTIARTGAVKTVDVVAHDTGMGDSAHANMIASLDGADVSPAKPADMTHTAADVSAAATQPGDVSTAAESTDMGATTEAAAHTASVAATAAAATARLCLRSKQTHRQKRRRQNRYHLFHRFLHSVIDGARHLTRRASPSF